MSTTGITIDTTKFDKAFKAIVSKAIPEALTCGLAKAGMRLLEDAIMEEPTVPLLEGTLRGSGSVFVNSELVHVSTHGKPGKANTSHSANTKNTATVGFNVPYATKLHESEGIKFTEPSAGSKFLTSKLSRNRNRYMQIVANTIKESEK